MYLNINKKNTNSWILNFELVKINTVCTMQIAVILLIIYIHSFIQKVYL